MQVRRFPAAYPFPPQTASEVGEKKLDYDSLPLTPWRGVIEEVDLFDDKYSKQCFEHSPKLAELVIRVVTKHELELVRVETQVTKDIGPDIHGVIFDVYAKDAEGNYHVIEIQNLASGMPIQRVGYYAMMLQFQNLPKGVDYDKIPDLHMIILSRDDIFHRGQLHSVINARWENGDLCEGFGIDVHYVAAEYATEETDIGRLMLDWSGTSKDNIFYKEIEELTHTFKKTKEGIMITSETYRKAYETEINLADARGFERGRNEGIEQGRNEGIEQGRNEGRNEVALANAKNMLIFTDNPADLIAKCTNLPFATIRELEITYRGK